MDKKKKALAFVVVLFLLVALEIVYIFSELYNESDKDKKEENVKITDSIKFKEEYESLNGKDNGNGKIIRAVSISDTNPIVYSTADEISTMIDNKETFIVYFGFGECPWCRSILESMLKAAEENNVDKIYYVDIENIRDKYELDDNHKAVKTQDGTEGYNKLLKKLSNVLSNYASLTYTNSKNKEVSVKVNEKRIYAPNVISVKNGKAVQLEDGIIDELTDPYMEITDDMSCEMRELFKCLFDTIKEDNSVCDLSATKC